MTTGTNPRRLAADLVQRIDEEGAYANLVLPQALDGAPQLSTAERGLITDLVYGTTRMRRACDWLTDRFVGDAPTGLARALLRTGAYELAFTDIPAYAAVSETVSAAPKRLRPFVNAILRKVADAPREWPDDGVRYSEPDWIIERLRADLGRVDADAALARMNEPPRTHVRADGYTQDLGSQWVVDAVAAAAAADPLVIDLCAAPGGKATGLAAGGARVVAADARAGRLPLVVRNARATGVADRVMPLVADATAPAVRRAVADVVLVDAPCSGLGVLRRRPDARWRIQADDVERLGALQREIVDAAVDRVRSGGVLAYSVCTLTATETVAVDEHLATTRPDLVALAPPGAPWRASGRGAMLLPQDADTDGMYLLLLRAPGGTVRP